MIRDQKIWRLVAKSHGEKILTALMVVLTRKGSSPGRQGFKMAITTEGEMAGTIGGGIMEYGLVEKIKDSRWHLQGKAELLPLVHRKNEPKHPSGMACSGEQLVALYPSNYLKPGLVDTALKIIEGKKTARLCFDDQAISVDASNFSPLKPVVAWDGEAKWSYQESIGKCESAYIIGGGHVGLALAETLSHLDFHTTILDSRRDVLAESHDHCADEKVVCPYSDLDRHVPSGAFSYVVVMTFSVDDDVDALLPILHKDFAYLGVMGSAVKISKIKNRLLEQGVPEEQLEKLRGPIGIPIHNETPKEIAISVAAEIIHNKNKS